MKLSDFKGLFKTSIAEVIAIDNPYGDYYTVKLKVAKGLVWEAGEHAIFKLPDREVEGKKWRAFSIASTSEEGFMLIGTRTGKVMSSFKKAMLTMKEGDKVAIRGPFGWFKLQDETSPLVMFAGGVGITPIRGLLMAVKNKVNRPIALVYASSDYYLFGEELEELSAQNEHLKIFKAKNAQEATMLIETLANQYGGAAYYYNSGTPKALKSIKQQLKKLGIRRNRIIDDLFLGY